MEGFGHVVEHGDDRRSLRRRRRIFPEPDVGPASANLLARVVVNQKLARVVHRFSIVFEVARPALVLRTEE